MKKALKIMVSILGGLLVTILALAIILPNLYEAELKELLKSEVNKRIEAKFDFEDLDLSLWKSLPNFRAEIIQPEILGINEFQQIELFKADNLLMDLDFASLIRDRNNIKIKKVNIENPLMQLITSPDGQVNWDIMKSSESETEVEPAPFTLRLDRVSISDGNFIYQDKSSNIDFTMDNIQLASSGNYDAEEFTLSNQLNVDQVNFIMNSIAYIDKARLSGQADLLMRLAENRYEFLDNSIQLNDLPIQLDGFLHLLEESMDMEFNFQTPSEDIRSVLSLIPSLYTESFEGMETRGKLALNGQIKGQYNGTQNILPGFDIQLDIKDGWLQYPEAPLPIDRIQTQIRIASLDKQMESFQIDIPQLNFLVDNQSVKGSIDVHYDPELSTYKGGLQGTIDLGKLSKAIPLEAFDQLSGQLQSDLTFDFNSKQLAESAYNDMLLSGNMTGKTLVLDHADYPAMNISTIDVNFAPREIQVDLGNGSAGKTDFSQVDVKIMNPLGFLSSDQIVSLDMKAYGNELYIDEWMPETTATQTNALDTLFVNPQVLPKNVKAHLAAKYNQVHYTDYDLNDLQIDVNYSDDKVIVQTFTGKMKSSDWNIRGSVNGLNGYLAGTSNLKGKLQLAASNIIVDEFIPVADGQEVQDSSLQPVQKVIPQNMDLSLVSTIQHLTYGNSTFNGVKGTINVVDRTLELHQVTSELLGGRMRLDGVYDEKPENPNFSLKYDARNLQFQQMFSSFLTMRKLAPIAKYIEGLFNTSLVFEGELSDGYIPVYDKINAAGFLETLKGTIKEFRPLEEIAKKLDLPEFDQFKLDDTKNWFEVVDGKVKVEEFKRKLEDIELQIAGNHAIDNDLDYTIFARVPREKFGKNRIANQVDAGLDWLKNEASRLGIDADAGDFVNLEIKLSGHILKPKVDIRLVDVSGKSLDEAIKDKVVQEATELKDSLQSEAEKEVEKIKDSVQTRIDQEKEVLKEKAKEKTSEVADSLTSVIKNRASQSLDSIGRMKVDSLIDTLIGKDKAQKVEEIIEKEAGKVQDILKEWNPFKKKKQDTTKTKGNQERY